MNRKKTIGTIGLLITIVTHCWAQTNSLQNRFQVDIDRGCTDLTVTITNLVTFVSDPEYWYTGTDITKPTSGDLAHTYDTPGSFYIVQLVNDASLGTNNTDSVLVEVLPSGEAQFTIRNCELNKIRVEIENDIYDEYLIEFTGSDNETVAPLGTSSVFDFINQGTYPIQVTGRLLRGLNNCGTQIENITTVNTITIPKLTSVELNDQSPNGEITLVHDLTDHIIYNLNSAVGNNSLEFDRQVESNQTELTDLNTEDQIHCFQLDTYDACLDLTYQSEKICTTLITSAEASEGGNMISWETIDNGITQYDVLRNGVVISSLPSDKNSYLDSVVICNVPYDYQVQTRTSGGSSLSISENLLTSESGSLPQITSFPQSTIAEDSIFISWEAPNAIDIPFDQYLVEKNINNRGWRRFRTTEETAITDVNIPNNGIVSYRIRYADDCENESTPSAVTSPIILSEKSRRGKRITYAWNRYEDWQQGIRGYVIEQLDENENVIKEFPVLSGREREIDFSQEDTTNKRLRVKATSLDIVPIVSFSNVTISEIRTQLHLPNSFTPDGDGINDRFTTKGPEISSFQMDIYNRWGNLIFTTNEVSSGWDGTTQKGDALEGSYVYKVSFKDLEGRSFDQTGVVMLFR